MPVSPDSIAVGKRYKRFSEVREVIAIDQNGNVTYVSRMPTDRAGHATGTSTLPKDRFAQEADSEVAAV